MTVEIITPQETIYKGDAKLVQVPGTKGSFEILNSHAPIISTIDKGTIRIVEEDDSEKLFEVKTGLIEVKENIVSLAVEV